MGISASHIILLLIYAAILIPPVARMLVRLGYSRWWAVLAIVPILNIIALWALAWAKWPIMRRS